MIVVLESKILKPPKAGAKASKEAIEMWTEVSLEHNIMMMKLSQPLATCMQNLQQGNLAINLQITAPSVATGISVASINNSPSHAHELFWKLRY
ncbi:hypothetical protein YC2023_107262 [Brassica napus]|uniref:Uncharacterized protein n=1 Tax=Brassica campestris TaxID=3711 RepID=A0A3P5XZ21_BRACM|nr:unnamed protein product [Brassica rapa]